MAQPGRYNKSQVSFNAGELSPKLLTRVDLEKYASAARQLQNATVMIYGGFVRRPGTQYIAEAKYSDRVCRLIDFRFSTTTTFILEVGHEYIRFFSNGGQVVSGGVPYEIATPYQESETREIQTCQINDVMYLVHPDHPPMKLSRLADTNWTLAEVVFDLPPFGDENTTSTTISVSATSGTGVTVTASTAIFEPGHVGSYWRLAHLREANSIEIALTGNATSSTLTIIGQWNLRTYGIWGADVLLQRSLDNGTSWHTIGKYLGDQDRNVDAQGTQDDEALFRIKVENYSGKGSGSDPRAVLEAADAYVYGTIKLTAVGSSGNTATANVVNSLHSTSATKIWREGSWSSAKGYPRAITIYEQRIIYAGTQTQPQTVWASVIGDYENFRSGTNADDSFQYTLGSKEQQTIQWVVPQGALLIGTTSGEWSMSAGAQDEPLSPTNTLVRQQSTYGSKAIAARVVNEVCLFFQRAGRKVREMVFSFERDGYVAPDLTQLSEHITGSGIIDSAYQQQIDSILWCITADGNLIGMTYERGQNVVAWHRHVTDGAFEAVATNYGSAGPDEVWFSIKRTINGNTVRYIERFHPQEWIAKEDAFFVDSGLTYTAPAVVPIASITPVSVGMTSSGGVYRRVYEFTVTTANAHGLADGDTVTIQGTGFASINGNTFTVSIVDSTQFKLLLLSLAGQGGPYVSDPGGLGDYYTETGESYDPLDVWPAEMGGTMRVSKNVFTGLGHLEGKTVSMLGDGTVIPDAVVTGGVVTLDDYYSIVHIGLGYETIFEPMLLSVDPAAGISLGQEKIITHIIVRFLNSLGLEYKVDDREWEELSFRDTIDPLDDAPPLFSGDHRIDVEGTHTYDPRFILKQSLPLPMTVLGVTSKYTITGD